MLGSILYFNILKITALLVLLLKSCMCKFTDHCKLDTVTVISHFFDFCPHKYSPCIFLHSFSLFEKIGMREGT